jgi:UDP-2-acetamido-2,6-beta-L-arabino-hexul-4-ose reductase
MIRVGITGQAGFIGTHLFNTLGLNQEDIVRIPFEDIFFERTDQLEDFVSQCDAIVHLAAMNRHHDPQAIYDTNIGLVNMLIDAMERKKVRPHVLFSSSIQEERDNIYGRSKREGRELLIRWAQRNNAPFTGFLIPNVFGPFGNPYYNSVIATFCHQLTHGETPKIEVDGQLKLIYVGELVRIIEQAIHDRTSLGEYHVPHTAEIKVSEILQTLKRYHTEYFEGGVFPELNSAFETNLFNTFRGYMDVPHHFPVALTRHADDRGVFVETVKSYPGGQVSFSTTKPGITRGNHFHTRKIERFAVIRGLARIQLRRIGTAEVINFDLDGNQPAYVDMPVWYTHNITNTGSDEMYCIFYINEFYDKNDPDTYFETV